MQAVVIAERRQRRHVAGQDRTRYIRRCASRLPLKAGKQVHGKIHQLIAGALRAACCIYAVKIDLYALLVVDRDLPRGGGI